MNEAARIREHYDRSAGGYDRSIGIFEKLLFGGGRAWVCSQAFGEVLEIAAGTGRNFPFYPAGARITATDISPAMLDIARRRAKELGIEADLKPGDAENLEFGDESFDCVVCTLGLCTTPSPERAASEAGRVLRPDGRLLLLEHVRSPIGAVRFGQRLLEPLAEGFEHDHLLRDPLDYLAASGFIIERCERSKLGIVERLVARKDNRGRTG